MTPPPNRPALLDSLEAAQQERKQQQRFRSLKVIEHHAQGTSTRTGKSLLNLSHNDYLGLGRHPEVIAAAQEATARWGTGSEASRLITGTTEEHHLFEKEYARFKGASSCLLFPTGYQASLSVFAALAKPGDTVLCDRLVHSCLVDGITLSSAKLRVFPHQDLARLEELLKRDTDLPEGANRWVCVDGVYSMDGDIAPLPQLLQLCAEHGAFLVVDDAHGTGMIGPTGRGIFEHFGLRFQDYEERVILISTLSKGLGSQGGAVCCHPIFRDELINAAKPFIFTTALAPACAAAARKALQIIETSPSLVQKLQQRSTQTLSLFREQGFDCLGSQTGIIPIMMGEESRAMTAAKALEEEGILLLPIRPPTVPKGTSRLRLSANLLLSDMELEMALSTIVKTIQELQPH